MGAALVPLSSRPAATADRNRPASRALNPGNDSPSTKDPEDTLSLSPEAQRAVQKLKRTDQEVRSHEAAHMAAGGGLVRGGPTYTYQRGPDGRTYAVGGEVSLDTSTVPGDPEATLRKAQQVKAAALAPANPSAQDRAVAASAEGMAAQARQDLSAQRNSATKRYSEAPSPGSLDLMA